MIKCYILLYTRDVVLELVQFTINASSKNFVYSCRKFIARRGCPRELLSDNRTVFTSQETRKFASNQNSWKFSLTNAPWYGSFWERLVSVVKCCLKKTVGRPA